MRVEAAGRWVMLASGFSRLRACTPKMVRSIEGGNCFWKRQGGVFWNEQFGHLLRSGQATREMAAFVCLASLPPSLVFFLLSNRVCNELMARRPVSNRFADCGGCLGRSGTTGWWATVSDGVHGKAAIGICDEEIFNPGWSGFNWVMPERTWNWLICVGNRNN